MERASIARACLWFILGVAAAGAVGMYWWKTQRSDPGYLRTVLLRNPEFLADNPEVLAAARAVLRQRQSSSEGEVRERLLTGRREKLLHVAFAPSLGNPAARSLLIEFTDYGCEPCKASAHAVRSVIESHAELRVAVMLLPTSGAVSEFAARVGYAAYRQNPLQFASFHERLMSQREPLSQAGVLAHAAAAGLDIGQLEHEIGSSEVRAHLAQVRSLADELRVPGVPTFVSGQRLFSGGASSAQLADLVRSGPSSARAEPASR